MRILLFPKQTKTTDIATPVVLCFIIQQLQLFWQLLRDLCSNRRKGKLCAAVLVRGTVGIPLCQQLSVWTMQFFFFLFLLSIFYLVLHPFFTPPQLPSILPEWLNEGLPHVNRNFILRIVASLLFKAIRFFPHFGHNPRQSSLHKIFCGKTASMLSRMMSVMSKVSLS